MIGGKGLAPSGGKVFPLGDATGFGAGAVAALCAGTADSCAALKGVVASLPDREPSATGCWAAGVALFSGGNPAAGFEAGTDFSGGRPPAGLGAAGPVPAGRAAGAVGFAGATGFTGGFLKSG